MREVSRRIPLLIRSPQTIITNTKHTRFMANLLGWRAFALYQKPSAGIPHLFLLRIRQFFREIIPEFLNKNQRDKFAHEIMVKFARSVLTLKAGDWCVFRSSADTPCWKSQVAENWNERWTYLCPYRIRLTSSNLVLISLPGWPGQKYGVFHYKIHISPIVFLCHRGKYKISQLKHTLPPQPIQLGKKWPM